MSTGTFDPDELEFLAEDIFVTIIPNVKFPIFYMLSGDIGPMEPNIPVEVPLWLAVHMRQRRQCRLVVPEWLSLEALMEQKDRELKLDLFGEVPGPFYVEMSQIILDNFTEEIPDSNKIRRLVKDIIDIRLSKLRGTVGLHVKKSEMYAVVNNITQIELCSLRNLLTRGMDQLDMLKNAGLHNAGGASQSFSDDSSALEVSSMNPS
ncbi:putative DNA replication complex GINS protein PSF2 [Hypsibius exemplaris]|uniref:GINS complex subunit 2 n=1 Tax=Hypsibius exemplaris TaxID=2072580 RepID=A0A1W0X0P7_HYPEX|nr:putative DNA replication complex GINS protein PSF2 [Hypsibius exemplaris]